MTFCIGETNASFGERGDRRRGHTRHDDQNAIAGMMEIKRMIGEDRPNCLAAFAIDVGLVELKGATRQSVIRRLVRGYRKLNGQMK
jgi:hypothetical protein